MLYDFYCIKCNRIYEIDIPIAKLDDAKKKVKCVDCKCKLKRYFGNQKTYFKFKCGFSTRDKIVDAKFGDPKEEVNDLNNTDTTRLEVNFERE